MRDRIEELVWGRHLKKIVNSIAEQERFKKNKETSHKRSETTPRRDEARSSKRPAEGTPRLRGVINTIANGFARGGSTSLARKRYLRTINNVYLTTDKVRRKIPLITFTNQDFNDPMVITVEVANFAVKKTFIDQGNIRGYVDLLTTLDDKKDTNTIFIQYLVMNMETSYNILIGRPTLNALKAIVSTPHLVMKFSSSTQQIVTIWAIKSQPQNRQRGTSSREAGKELEPLFDE
ncbi:hypothetical protein CR513_37062, partial [Mucuna pruriens]